MGSSQGEKLVIGRKYYLISNSKNQSWNDGICVLDSIEKNRVWHYKNTYIGEFFKPFCEFREKRINQILYE